MTTIANKTVETLTWVKDHVKRNKFTYFLAFLALVLGNGNRLNSKHFDKFLIQKGHDPLEFWCEEAYLEKIQ